ncbi:unnamed protein product [Miscanthus lutarioriparius]|uniref:DUF659 domain-containing protein n=1 Tax=Miscanthus lutarioriparius TaxID=422564 RepID=A0A811QK79_9POAL|nr:unnamed protein product [Miscanthus lutarioriparius]
MALVQGTTKRIVCAALCIALVILTSTLSSCDDEETLCDPMHPCTNDKCLSECGVKERRVKKFVKKIRCEPRVSFFLLHVHFGGGCLVRATAPRERERPSRVPIPSAGGAQQGRREHTRCVWQGKESRARQCELAARQRRLAGRGGGREQAALRISSAAALKMSSSLPPPTSGEGTSNSSRAGAVSPAVLIDVDAAPTPAAIGQVKDDNIFNVWNYGFSVGQGFRCGFCGATKRSGGETRLTQHLAGVPSDVKHAMWRKHKESKDRKKDLKRTKKRLENTLVSEMGGKGSIYVASDEEEEQTRLLMALSRQDNDLQQEVNMRQASYEHGSVSSSALAASSGSCRRPPTVQPRIDSFVTSSSSVQPRIDTTLKQGEMEKLAQAWSKWFHANDIAGVKANCPYFRAAMRLTQELGTTSRLFSGSDIDGPCLDANYKSIEEAVEVFKRDWKKYGVTVMCDSWTGTTSMSIINFMVYCHGRIFFHKAINASEHIQNAEYLYTHIKKVVDDIGPKNIVQLVTDNGANYKKACAKLIDEYPRIVWQPCAAHTMPAADWWVLFGGDTPELQKFAIRIVSQCVSSSGCERNWSTFALVHTKLRNRLGYEKLQKLVYVRHNLKQRLKQGVGKNQTEEKEADPCALLMDCTLFDESNPIMDWLNRPKIVDDDLCLEELLGWSKKRKILALQRANRRRKGKRVVEDEEEDFVETENDIDDSSPHGSPAYAESADSSSANDTDNEPEHRDGDTLGTHQQFEEQREDDNRRGQRARKKKRKELISGDQNGNIRVWDLAANSCSCELVPEVDTAVRSLTVMWDGSMVVAANNHGTCYVWRLLKGTQTITCFEPLHKLQAHDGYILKCLLSPEFCDPNSFFRHHSEAMDDVNRRGHRVYQGHHKATVCCALHDGAESAPS